MHESRTLTSIRYLYITKNLIYKGLTYKKNYGIYVYYICILYVYEIIFLFFQIYCLYLYYIFLNLFHIMLYFSKKFQEYMMTKNIKSHIERLH